MPYHTSTKIKHKLKILSRRCLCRLHGREGEVEGWTKTEKFSGQVFGPSRPTKDQKIPKHVKEHWH